MWAQGLSSSRSAFGLSADVVPLNHGSYGALPRSVAREQALLRAAMEADPTGYMDRVPERLRAVCVELAGFLGAHATDLALVENATEGVSTVLRSIRWREGDVVLSTSHTYGAVQQALGWLKDRHGVIVRVVDVPFPITGPDQVLGAVLPQLDGVRLAVIDAITSPTGLVWPLSELVVASRERGVMVLVDAAHAPGHVELDLDHLGADWVTGNLHKWAFAPRGAAFLWARHDRQAGLDPLVLSHPLSLGFPRSFDWTGTRDPSSWLAVPAALRAWSSFPDIRASNRALCQAAAGEIAHAWGVARPAPDEMLGAMCTLPLPFEWPPARAAELHDRLRADGIQVPVVPFGGRTWIRISAQVYNVPGDYERLAVWIRRFQRTI